MADSNDINRSQTKPQHASEPVKQTKALQVFTTSLLIYTLSACDRDRAAEQALLNYSSSDGNAKFSIYVTPQGDTNGTHKVEVRLQLNQDSNKSILKTKVNNAGVMLNKNNFQFRFTEDKHAILCLFGEEQADHSYKFSMSGDIVEQSKDKCI